MTTLLEKLEQVKAEYNERMKKLDDLVKSAYIATASISASMKQMEETFKTIEIQIKDLNNDYEKLKEDINNNRWMKFFKIKL